MPALPDRKNYRKDWKHFIAIPSLAGKYIGEVTIDNKYLLYKDPDSYALAILPPLGAEHPSFEDLFFYANCLAYDHDAPSLLLPKFSKIPVDSLQRKSRRFDRDQYCEGQCLVLESLGNLKWGSLQYVQFRWGDLKQAVDISYSSQYRSVTKELSLYGLALRQFDPLSEFLHYYRIMESVGGANHKNWIKDNLDRIESFDFGFLELEDGLLFGKPKRRVNLFRRYRRKAQARLKQLRHRLTGQSIEKYFYDVNRCGIAHGKDHVRHYDFSTTVADIWKDLYVIKLLSRFAIQDKMGSGNLVHKAPAPGSFVISNKGPSNSAATVL